MVASAVHYCGGVALFKRIEEKWIVHECQKCKNIVYTPREEANTCHNCNGKGYFTHRLHGRFKCSYCGGTGYFEHVEIDHRKHTAPPWGYWKDWGIKCQKCDKMLDWRNAAQPNKCPSCGYGGEK